MTSAIYIYPFFIPTASHSLRIHSAKLSMSSGPLPLTAAAIPKVPGQAANTPAASFMPNTISPCSFLELERTITGRAWPVPSATMLSWLIQSASSPGPGF